MSSNQVTLTIVVALFAFGCATAVTSISLQPGVGTQAETIAASRAEEFVRVNGYVARQDADPARAIWETTDSGEIEAILDSRAGTLLSAACAIRREDASVLRWIVVFCYDPRNNRGGEANLKSLKNSGRAVVMDLDGVNPHMMHQDFFLRGHGFKVLPGMRLFKEVFRKEAAELRAAAGRAAPGR